MKPPTKDVSALVHAAMAAQQQGAAREARRLYEQALRAVPRNPDILHLLGLTWIDEGQTEHGLQLIRRAIAFRPDYLEAINNIAIELAKLGRHEEARSFFAKALRLNDAQADVHFNMGRSQHALGDLPAALASYDQAIGLRETHFEAWNNRGITQHALGEYEAAIASYDRAVALNPNYHEAWTNRAVSLNALERYHEALDSLDNALVSAPDFAEAWLQRGNSLIELGALDRKALTDALTALDKGLALKPDSYEGWLHRGFVLTEFKRFDDALAAFDRADALRPNDVNALLSRSVALQRQQRRRDALNCADRAIAINADNSEAWSTRAVALLDFHRYEEALDGGRKAVQLVPGSALFHTNLGYMLLRMGRFADGWAEHEWRWTKKDGKRNLPNITAPPWLGEELRGRHLLVFSEQGFGDIIQFARYLPIIRALGARVTFLCPEKMVRLLRLVTVDTTVISNPAHAGNPDFQAALLSLPAYLGTDLASIPANVPYIGADAELTEHWAARIGTHGRRIGIAWQGNPDGVVDIGRSFPVAALSPIAALPDVRLISLQKGFGMDQLAALPQGMTVETLGGEFDSGPDAFVDTAAAMMSLDLVITSDTAIAHVAGALGRPVWVALQYNADWRWLLDRDDSPWYPSMRLFRQPEPCDWTSVFADMRAVLEKI